MGQKRITTEEFIRKARLIHGDKYDYSKVEYKNSQTKVCIICPIHGEFWQTPGSHLSGHGCPVCGWVKGWSGRKTTTDVFIRKAQKVHGDFYDYSKADYINPTTPICIICPIHGEFWITPNNHLRGEGCRHCSYIDRGIRLRLTTEDFIKRARMVHGDKYDYSKVEYKDSHTDVCIICPEHGEFWQTPNSHLCGQGCPKCRESKGEIRIRKHLDSRKIKYIRQYFVSPNHVLFGRNKFYIDFYLPDYNTFIEFNGEQHYRRIKTWHTEEQFADQQDRDRRLREYCKQHKIRLIEIPYTEIDNIDKILTKKILKSINI